NNFAYYVSIDTLTGMLWIGTDGGGINSVDLKMMSGDLSKIKFRHFTTDEGLPDNFVSALLPDGRGGLWLGTQDATCYFTPPSSLGGNNNDSLYPNGIMKIFRRQDGLP